MNRRLFLTFCLLLGMPFVALAQTAAPTTEKTALDRYVETPDAAYKYEMVSKTPGSGFTTYVLDMTSQTWRSANEVDRTAWKHWMIIVKPDEVKTTKSLLYISGGNNNNPPPKGADGQISQIAVATKSVVTELRMIPNQPLTFSDDRKSRTEDGIIAYTWDKYIRGGDDQWPLRLPMTKAAVRAMDTVASFMAKESVTIDRFVVTGGSKRGWTTWTTAVVDKRVVAIVPIVIDMLNVIPSFQHHHAVYGYYAPAVDDYEEMGIMARQDNPRYKALMKIEEPYEYRDRLTLPKFIINATGDQFFLPDSWKFYFNDLPGVKHLRYVPNAEHSLRGSDAWMTLLACYNSILTDAPLPQYSWKVEKDGTIRVTTKDKPTAVKLWQAANPGARDFRLTSLGAKWVATPLAETKPGEYIVKPAAPKKGWIAYMVEVTFSSGLALAPYKFTTGVKVLPDVYP